MDDDLLSLFQTEVSNQCRLVLIGSEQLDAAMERPRDRYAGDPTALVWAALQSILVAAANISKLLWGSGREPRRAQLTAARKPLRDSIEVDDESVLQSTRLRNDFEHFDQRMEEWSKSGSPHFIGRNIGEPSVFAITGEEGKLYGHFTPSTWTVEFWDHSVDVRAVTQAADELLRRLLRIQGFDVT
jgi:hypothetical protein